MTNKTISHLTSIVAMISLIQGSGGVIAAVPANADNPINIPLTHPTTTPNNTDVRAVLKEIKYQLPNYCAGVIPKYLKDELTETLTDHTNRYRDLGAEDELAMKLVSNINRSLKNDRLRPEWTSQCEAFLIEQNKKLTSMKDSIEAIENERKAQVENRRMAEEEAAKAEIEAKKR